MSDTINSRTPSIMSVAEAIDSAFGLHEENTVNHKLMQAVLFIMAKQLKLLERQVEVKGPRISPSPSTLSITEVRLQAKNKQLGERLSGVDVAGIKGVRATFAEGGKLKRGVRGKAKAEIERMPKTAIEAEESEEIKQARFKRQLKDTEMKAKVKKRQIGIQEETDEKEKRRKEKFKKDKKTEDDYSSSSETLSQKSFSTESTTDIKPDKNVVDGTDKSDKAPTVTSSSEKTDKLSSDKKKSDKSAKDESALDKTTKAKSSFVESSSEESSISDKPETEKPIIDKSSIHRTPSTDQKTLVTSETSLKETSLKETSFKETSLKETSDKTSLKDEKTALIKTSSTDKASVKYTSSDEKVSPDDTKKSSLKHTPSAKQTTEKHISSLDETGAEKTSLDRTASHQVSSTEKISPAEKISSKLSQSSDKTAIIKTPSEKSIEKRTPSTDKTTLHRTESDKFSVKSPDDIIKESSSKERTVMSPSDKSTTDRTSSAKTSTQQTKSSDTSRDKTATETRKDKISSPEKSISKSDSDKNIAGKGEKSSSTKRTTVSSTGKKVRLNRQLQDALEEQREAILRIIHQRHDSREEQDKSPTPMVSLDSVTEAQYEKLLVVERVSSEEAREREKAARRGRPEIPKLSIVTQEEFDALAETVRRIQLKYKEVGRLELPENVELMQELRKGASLTDAMGALQLSARLEAAEKTLQNMMNLVTELALKTPGVDVTPGDEMKVIYGAPGAKTKSPVTLAGIVTPASGKTAKSKKTASEESMEMLDKPASLDNISAETTVGMTTEKDRVTFFELDVALQKIQDQIMGVVNENSTKNKACAEKIQKQVKKLEGRLNSALDLGDRMEDVEALVAQYAEKINALDTGLSSQMTSYQEELTQMQHDLETGLDTMAEVLANAGSDTTAITELNTHFSNLQADIDNTMFLQKDLQETQGAFAYDLSNLRAQIESLRSTKSDRDEVADALRDKAGLSELNGLVSTEQFDAVRGDIQKRILIAYDKFNNQEAYWQKIIDDLTRDLNDKADIVQVKSLQSEVDRNMEILTAKLNVMMEIVGEPHASALTRKLHRDEACLSCATPAHLELKAPKVPALPGLRPPAIGAEAPRPREYGDHKPCYPGKPIPHPIDPRAHICKRWCGGSHTVVPTGLTKTPPGIKISTIVRDTTTTTTVGTDGKMYQTDEALKKPCKPCKIHPPTQSPQAEPELAKEAEDTEEAKLPSTVMDECTCFPICGLLYR